MLINDEKESEMDRHDVKPDAEKPACTPGVTRKEFLAKVLKRSAIAGSLLAAPAILDKFMIPPVYAAASSGGSNCSDADTTTGGFTDSVGTTFAFGDTIAPTIGDSFPGCPCVG